MAQLSLYLVRHAIAEERGADWPDDDLRPLTGDGIKRFTQAARGFASLEDPPERVITSPLVRARQTAELLAAALDIPRAVSVMDQLAPGHHPSQVLAQVRQIGALDSIALVGHEPDLGVLAAQLVGAARPLPFKKGGICRIDLTWGRSAQGTLAWFLPPKLLRMLAP